MIQRRPIPRICCKWYSQLALENWKIGLEVGRKWTNELAARRGKSGGRGIGWIVLTEKNIVNIWTGDRSEEREGGRNESRGEAGLDCMVITINNGNLVCKWLETPARPVPTYNFPPFSRQESTPLPPAYPPILPLPAQLATLKCLESTFARAPANWFYLNAKYESGNAASDLRN